MRKVGTGLLFAERSVLTLSVVSIALALALALAFVKL